MLADRAFQMARIEPEWVRIWVTNHAQTSLRSALTLEAVPEAIVAVGQAARFYAECGAGLGNPCLRCRWRNTRSHCTARAALAGSGPRAAGSQPAPKANAASSRPGSVISSTPPSGDPSPADTVATQNSSVR